MPSFMRPLLLALSLLVSACVTVPSGGQGEGVPPPRRAPLILVSLDGFRADYLGRGRSPVLSALAASGVTADAMRPAFPSVTEPNHYTLVTGLYPDHHGIVYNVMEDPNLAPNGFFNHTDHRSIADERWWNAATPLWVGAERRGLRTAAMFWPGSDVAIHGVRPSLWKPYDGTVAPERRVDGVLEWLDLPEGQRPDFITLYFEQADEAGHAGGPDSMAVDEALGRIDGALGRLFDGLRRRNLFERVNLLIVSDHGMAATAAERVVFLDDLADPADVHVLTTGAVTELRALPGREAAVESRLLMPREHVACWRKADIPVALHYGANSRVPPFVCLAEPGWLVTSRRAMAEMQAKGRAFGAGAHGYDPADPAMAALFVAHGPAFRSGVRQPAFDNVELYSLLCRLLNVPPEPNDGQADRLLGILRTD
ncbi:ectonucleotide pyrophosphatase/phosphodiesterase [Telmatospirillum siberiense]|uniref:Alkaline phosphatase family protein n=1 Tax=Telmatospirillum siberiense TaxID=382514 RepID=A0A2N3PTZ5_9PROT|nr:ectonucleotide pyrophosphatase/phosphodiesterase [Telmatospirillum siberiense]PKU23856.1 alkaline phosphatase family protein [Telmatospirillum siberiense]